MTASAEVAAKVLTVAELAGVLWCNSHATSGAAIALFSHQYLPTATNNDDNQMNSRVENDILEFKILQEFFFNSYTDLKVMRVNLTCYLKFVLNFMDSVE